VKILTIHASKGLEYPIVLLPNLNQNFKGGMTPDVYVEEKYGLAPRSFDTERMIHSSNLLRRLHEKKEGEKMVLIA
jgi:ATP-dependent exoDNAse (exonuclease V) beta subunit